MKIVDNQGRQFEFAVNIGTIARCEKASGVNLCRLLDSEQGIASLNDPLRVCEYIYHTSDAPSRGISLEDFGAGFSGDTLGQAVDKFHEEFASFFPNPTRRQMVKRMLELYRQAEQAAIKQLEKLTVAPEAAVGN